MKSIKEKAEEYAKTKHTDKNLIDIVSWDFEAGANYVIAEIERALCSNGTSRLKIATIKDVIDKLKEE